MTQQEFERLSEKFNQGTCTPDELVRLEQWLEAEEGHTEGTVFTDKADEENSRLRIWRLIQEARPLVVKKRFSFKRSYYLFAGVAAVVLMIVSALWIFPTARVSEKLNQSIVGVESKNAGKAEQQIMLPDSSTVFLDAGASLIVDEDFGKSNRIVQLKGGAYFNIRKNIRKPFLVYVDGLVTEVLGTSFYIRPEEKSRKIEVAVVTGKVSVYTKGSGENIKRDGVIISPNQKIVYDTELQTIRQDLIDFPRIIHHEAEVIDFNFNETTIEEVLNRMQRSYGIEIVVVNPVINKCKVTGNLNGIDMHKQLEFVCEVLNARYELRGSAIFIMGNECL